MPVPTQGCILSRYLAEQELACRRMERTANPDTPHGQEWHSVAEMLLAKRAEHVAKCALCMMAMNVAVTR
jgi:hypothetical protein